MLLYSVFNLANSSIGAGVIRKLILLKILLFLVLFPSVLLAEEPIQIGALFSLSSWGAEGGQQELNGIRMAEDEINSNGGIAGKKIELIIEDNQSNLKQTASAFQKLVHVDRVPVVLGPNWVEFLEIVAPLAERFKVPFISASGYSESSLKSGDFTFSLWASPGHATSGLAKEISRQGVKKVAILLTVNSYYEGLYRALSKQLKELDVAVGEPMRFQEGEFDYRSTLGQLSRSKPDAVVAFLLEGGEIAAFLKQRAELDFKLPIYSANAISFDSITQSNLSIAEGVVFFDYFVPGGEKFHRQYRERFNSEPGFGSAKAYDSLFLVKKAIEQCGETPKEIRECLSKVNYEGISGKISFLPGGAIDLEGKESTYLLKVQNAKIVPLASSAQE